MDEKIPTGVGEHSTPPSEIETSRDWSVEEERKAKWKLDLLIMPILTLGFFCLRKITSLELDYEGSLG